MGTGQLSSVYSRQKFRRSDTGVPNAQRDVLGKGVKPGAMPLIAIQTRFGIVFPSILTALQFHFIQDPADLGLLHLRKYIPNVIFFLILALAHKQ